MKKIFIIAVVASLSLFTSCKKQEPFVKKISQLRENVFVAEAENYSVHCYAELREEPNLNDGNPADMKPLVTFKIIPKNNFDVENKELSIEYSFNEESYKGNFEFKPLAVVRYSYIHTESLPTADFKAVLTIDDSSEIIELHSKKRADLIPYATAVAEVKKHAQNSLDVFFDDNETGEIKIRLIENDGYNFWYVGFFDAKNSVSYLVDGLTGEILAIKNN